MQTYAESKLAPEQYGFPIFYELLPLGAALAEEASAIESDRDAFGEEFDAYRTSQLDMVRSVYAAGSAVGTAYSVRAPNGEWTSAIALTDLAPLSPEQFEAERAMRGAAVFGHRAVLERLEAAVRRRACLGH